MFIIAWNFLPFYVFALHVHAYHVILKVLTYFRLQTYASRFFSRTFLTEFSLISEVRSFSFLACILKQECRKYLSINLRKYLYFSQGLGS